MRTGVILGALVAAGGVLAGEFAAMDMMNMGMLMPRASATAAVGSGGNLQTFTGALGGVAADPITKSTDASRPFVCSGNTFPAVTDAQQRSCSNQHNSCADVANGANNTAGITVAQCDTQQTSCLAASLSSNAVASAAASSSSVATTSSSSSTSTTQTTTAVATLFSSDANFDYFCDP